MKKDHIIIGVHVTDRMKNVMGVQGLLSEYGCNIKTRLGLHEVSETLCASNGLLLLEMAGAKPRCLELADKLNAIEGVEAKTLVFSHN